VYIYTYLFVFQTISIC